MLTTVVSLCNRCRTKCVRFDEIGASKQIHLQTMMRYVIDTHTLCMLWIICGCVSTSMSLLPLSDFVWLTRLYRSSVVDPRKCDSSRCSRCIIVPIAPSIIIIRCCIVVRRASNRWWSMHDAVSITIIDLDTHFLKNEYVKFRLITTNKRMIRKIPQYSLSLSKLCQQNSPRTPTVRCHAANHSHKWY